MVKSIFWGDRLLLEYVCFKKNDDMGVLKIGTLAERRRKNRTFCCWLYLLEGMFERERHRNNNKAMSINISTEQLLYFCYSGFRGDYGTKL